MSETYADAYLKFHEDLSSLALNDVEMALLSAIALFSAGTQAMLLPFAGCCFGERRQQLHGVEIAVANNLRVSKGIA